MILPSLRAILDKTCQFEVAMGKAKEQHYVPQFHLRAFASDKNEKCINVYNLKRKEYFENVPIKGQGKKPYLYGKNNGVEERLGKIEGLLASSFRQISQSDAIGQEHIDHVLLFINLSFIRTYQMISDLLGTTSEAQEVMKKNNPELRRMIDSFDFSSEVVGELVLSSVEKAWINSLDLKIALIKNATNKDFITSDSPASRYNFYLEKKISIGANSNNDGRSMCFSPPHSSYFGCRIR